MLPLVCPTLARRGHTPALVHRARHRDKVSVAGALTLSPERGRAGLLYRTYPGGHVDAEAYCRFLRGQLLRCRRRPVVLLHDRGNMHRGPRVREFEADFPRLHLEPLPAYAPELNPVEPLWRHLKRDELGNFVPADVPELDRAIHACLDETKDDQAALKSFFATAELPWGGLPGLF
jgi:transposase